MRMRLLSPNWAFLVSQMAKNLPTMGKTQVWSLSWEDPLEKGMEIHSNILTWRISQSLADYSPCGHKESDRTEQLSLSWGQEKFHTVNPCSRQMELCKVNKCPELRCASMFHSNGFDTECESAKDQHREMVSYKTVAENIDTQVGLRT